MTLCIYLSWNCINKIEFIKQNEKYELVNLYNEGILKDNTNKKSIIIEIDNQIKIMIIAAIEFES